MAADNEIDPETAPSGPGCVECLAADGWRFHLRRCARCGHIGCCDSSPSQHAIHHAAGASHPVIRSFEKGEDWFWNYATEQYLALGASELRVLVAAGFTGPLLASALPPDVTPAGVARLFMVDDEAAMAKAAVLYGDSVRLAGPRVSIIRPISGRNRLPRP